MVAAGGARTATECRPPGGGDLHAAHRLHSADARDIHEGGEVFQRYPARNQAQMRLRFARDFQAVIHEFGDDQIDPPGVVSTTLTITSNFVGFPSPTLDSFCVERRQKDR
jgi:hypothetical protein